MFPLSLLCLRFVRCLYFGISYSFYAQIVILVSLILVNFFLDITRDHGSCEGRHQVEILPTGLPDLSKPSKPTKNLKKRKMLETIFLKNPKNSTEY